MSVRRTIPAAGAALSMALGLAAAAAVPAAAATPECGPGCIEVFTPALGTHEDPRFVEAVLDGVARVGQPMVLRRASNSDPSEDLTPHGGLVSDFFDADMVSAAVNAHYGDLPAAQLEYSPSGTPSGLCVGLARVAHENQPLSLQPCRIPGTTVWIVDTADSPATAAEGYFPLVNGSTRDLTHPYAMTYPKHAHPTDEPAPLIRVRHLGFCEDGAVPARQLWGTELGVVQ
jgi:hypothetical protein